MSVPLWAWELARAFWRMAGPAGGFPRRLRPALERSPLLVTVEALPRLSTRRVRDYLAARGVAWAAGEDRRLRGFLIAPAGQGFLFLDADDPDDEREFSLAHELAHFLRHEWQPRERAKAALGHGCVEAIDGQRPPRLGERAAAVLGGVRLTPYTHLMAREGGSVAADVIEAESEADRLALELLAPEKAVTARRPEGRDAAAALLRRVFGLPAGVAEAYAARLFPAAAPTPLSDMLRKALQARRTPAAGEEQGGRR